MLSKKQVLDYMIKNSEDYADIDVSMHECIMLLCEDLANDAYNIWFTNEALSHGIPLSVIENKTKLSDHFSNEYIDFKTNKKDKL